MSADEEALTQAIAARVTGPDGTLSGPLRLLFTWLAGLELERGVRELSVLEVAAGSSVHRAQVIEAFRALGAAGAGRFIHGRRGFTSRFRPGDVNLVRVARALIADRDGVTLVPHTFRLRPDVTLALSLPSDLCAAEASRVAAFVRTLPIDAVSRRPTAGRGHHADSTADDPSAVVLGMSRLRISLPVMVALSEGLFQREGLRVELHTFETAQPLMDAIITGSIPAGGFIAFPISMAAELNHGVGLRHLAIQIEDDAHPISRMLVRPHAGLHSLQDLRGKRIGILPTFAYRAWLEVLLRGADVDPGGVEIRELSPASGASALCAGALDALFTNDPAATMALCTGAVPLELTPGVARAVLYPLPFGSFVVSATFADARPRVAAALARALDAAIDLAAADPDRVHAALEAHLPEAQAALVRAFPPSRYAKSSAPNADALTRLRARYHELGVLRDPLAPVP